LSEKEVEQIEKAVAQIENETHLVQDISEPTGVDGNPVLAKHLRYERNSPLINKIKERALARNKMLNCQVCKFSFLEKYGEIGKGFIEAHHKKPLSEIKRQTRKTEDDFILVCSNCHRMLHQNSLAIDVKELKLLIKKD
jgi:predicted HNH restriction endonuclease